jgi:diguanylate cyclase (GGDEF)-like protein/PAS domain S-box-containing protein
MRPDGEVRFVVSRGMPELDQEGRVKALVGVFMDVTDYTRAGDTLRASEQRLKLALSTTKLGLWDLDVNTGVRQWSDEMREILGVSGEVQASREVFLTRLHPEDRARLQNERYPLLPNGTSRHRSVLRILRADNGDERWIEVAGEMLHDEDGRPTRYIGLVQDITARRTAEEALRASEERLRLALQAGRMFAWERDLATGYVERSSNAKDLIGIGSGPVSDFIERLHPADQEKGPAVTTGEWGCETEQSELRYIRPDGRLMWLAARSTLFRETGRPERLIGVTFDITDRKAAEEDLWRVANQDSLTGLPNRAMFHRRLEEALSEAQRDGTSVSLLLIDLDGFKDVNDTLGHDAGDALLVETAKRLGEFVRDGDTVARLGGDEFAVVLVAPFELTNAASLAEHVIARLSQSFTYADRIVPSRASAGVAGFPEHHHTPSELLKDADLALYRAKAQGRNRVVTYAPEMREATERRVTIAREVQEAVREGQIVPFYQPKVSFTTGRIIGFEALARWQHPTKGVLTPGYFGSVFEDPELAVAIGESIVSQVAADIRTWLDRGLDCGRVAVNLSSAEFADPYLAVNTLGLLREAEVPLEHFEVEVTETVLLGRSADYVGSILRRFHESGVRIALDDFGTGFASLTHLKQFPVDHIKVDQSFVRDLEHDRDDAAIVAAVIGLGRSLGIEVTAEGVETVGQAGHLRQMGCTNAQGYLYAKPMVGSRVPWLLETWANPFALSDGKSRRAASGAIP